jgi:hypothetical protein
MRDGVVEVLEERGVWALFIQGEFDFRFSGMMQENDFHTLTCRVLEECV